MLGLFTLGMFIPWASSRAALISAVTSLLVLLWIAIGGNISRFLSQIIFRILVFFYLFSLHMTELVLKQGLQFGLPPPPGADSGQILSTGNVQNTSRTF